MRIEIPKGLTAFEVKNDTRWPIEVVYANSMTGRDVALVMPGDTLRWAQNVLETAQGFVSMLRT
jgi:hypothetical protein